MTVNGNKEKGSRETKETKGNKMDKNGTSEIKREQMGTRMSQWEQ